MSRYTLNLTDEEKTALCKMRDNGQPAYLRERAAAILKIGSGMSPHKVALSGLLKKRKPDTVYNWLSRFRKQRIQELFQNLAEAENMRLLRSPKKTQRKNYKTL